MKKIVKLNYNFFLNNIDRSDEESVEIFNHLSTKGCQILAGMG